jgi:hypothetical protein
LGAEMSMISVTDSQSMEINVRAVHLRPRGIASQEAMPSSEDFEHVRGAGASNPPAVVNVLRE